MKYKAKISVDYEFEVEVKGFDNITQSDINHYKAYYNDEYNEGTEEIESVEHVVLHQLECAIYANIPYGVPDLSNIIVKSSHFVNDMSIEKL